MTHTFLFITPENIKHILLLAVEEGRKFLTYFSWAWIDSGRATLEERTGARSLHSKNFLDKKKKKQYRKILLITFSHGKFEKGERQMRGGEERLEN